MTIANMKMDEKKSKIAILLIWTSHFNNFIKNNHFIGLHKLRAWLQLFTYHACKQCYVYMKICAKHWFLCVKLIGICQWVHVVPPLIHCVVMLAPSLHCTDVFCLFLSQFCSPAIKQIFSQCKDWFPFILLCRQEKYRWTGPLGLHINYTDMNWEQFMYSLKNYLNVINIS